MIRAGEWDTQTSNEPLPVQDREVAIIRIHPEYHAGALTNDFALLVLSQPVSFADNVDVICLPEFGENFDRSSCTATGWGTNEFGRVSFA